MASGKEVPTSGLVGRNLMLCIFWDKSLSLLGRSFLTSKMGSGSVMRSGKVSGDPAEPLVGQQVFRQFCLSRPWCARQALGERSSWGEAEGAHERARPTAEAMRNDYKLSSGGQGPDPRLESQACIWGAVAWALASCPCYSIPNGPPWWVEIEWEEGERGLRYGRRSPDLGSHSLLTDTD